MSVASAEWPAARSVRRWGYYLVVLAGIIAVGHLVVQSRLPPAVAPAIDLSILLLMGVSVAAVKVARALKQLEDRVHKLESR